MTRPASLHPATMSRDEIRAFILERPEETAHALAQRLGLTPMQVAGYRAGATRQRLQAPHRHLASIRTTAGDLRRLADQVAMLAQRLDTQLRLFHGEFLSRSVPGRSACP